MRSTPELEACIDHCLACHRICLEAAIHALETQHGDERADAIRLLLDCAEICATSARFMLHGSALHGVVCGACAEICEACEETCRQLDDDVLQRCAEACARCAESCRRMAASTHGGIVNVAPAS